MCIRGFLSGNGGYHAKELDVVVHGGDDWKERIRGERKGKRLVGTVVLGLFGLRPFDSPFSFTLLPISLGVSISLSVTVTHVSLIIHHHVLSQKTCLCHRYRHGRLRKVHFCPKVECPFTFTIPARSSLCPQPRSCRDEPFLRSKYRHSRYRRLPRGHEAVRSRSSFPPYDHPPQVVHPRYNLGPNGGILTALNLFTTKFDQVLDLVEKRAETVESASASFSYCWDPLSHAALFVFIQLCDRRYTRTDRDFYLVSIWRNYYRCSCLCTPNRRRLHRRYTACRCACDVHVEYALCL